MPCSRSDHSSKLYIYVMHESDSALFEVSPFISSYTCDARLQALVYDFLPSLEIVCGWVLCRSTMAPLLTASKSVTMWVGVCFLSVTAPLSTASRSVTIQVCIVQKYECDNVDVCCTEV